VTVVEWAERWLDEGRGSRVEGRALPKRLRRVWIETLGETERRITYEDLGA
jgi:hypothetical protein